MSLSNNFMCACFEKYSDLLIFKGMYAFSDVTELPKIKTNFIIFLDPKAVHVHWLFFLSQKLETGKQYKKHSKFYIPR